MKRSRIEVSGEGVAHVAEDPWVGVGVGQERACLSCIWLSILGLVSLRVFPTFFQQWQQLQGLAIPTSPAAESEAEKRASAFRLFPPEPHRATIQICAYNVKGWGGVGGEARGRRRRRMEAGKQGGGGVGGGREISNIRSERL